MPILFPSITLGYSGVVSFYQLYLFLLSHHNFHLLVIIFGLTIYLQPRDCVICFLLPDHGASLLFHSTVVSISCSWSAPVLSCSTVKSSVCHFILRDLEQMVSGCTMYKFYFVGLTKILHVFVLEFTPIV